MMIAYDRGFKACVAGLRCPAQRHATPVTGMALLVLLLVGGILGAPALAAAQTREVEYLKHSPAMSGIFSYPWRVAEATTRQLIQSQGSIDGKHVVDDTTTIAVTSLSFYSNVELIYVKDKRWKPENLFVYFLVDEQQNLYRLAGTSPPIHAVNAANPLNLTPHTVRDYLWFFCFFVRGEEGPFLIAETIKDTFVPKKVKASVLRNMEKHLRPAQLRKQNGDGSFEMSVIVYYSNALFESEMTVARTGMIEMKNDTAILADLPAKIDAPLR